MTPIFAASTSGIGALGVDFSALAIQLITFVLAYIVLRKFAYGPIVKIMEQRRKVIEDGVTLGEQMRRQEEETKQQVAKKMHQARAEADQIIADASESAKQIVHEAESQAKVKADQLLKEAAARTEIELAQSRRKLETEMVNLVAQATSAVLDEKVDTKQDGRLIERALAGKKG